jgi:Tfp pilus assembly protein PilF
VTRIALALFVLSALTAPAAAQAQGSARTAALEAQLLLRPADATLYVALAAERERLGDAARAEAALRQGIGVADDARAVRAALTDFLARAGRWSDAVAVAESLGNDARAAGFRARLRVNAGVAAYRAGEKAAARRHFERALADEPGLEAAAANLGALLLELGDRDGAGAVAARALALHPEHEQLKAVRAAALGGPEGYKAALAALRRRRAADPANEAVGLELAAALAGGDRAAAAALYDTLLQAPSPAEAAFTAASRFWLDGNQPAFAAERAERGLERFPRSSTLLMLLGDARSAGGDWREAATAYRRAIPRLASPDEAELPLLDALVQAGDSAAARDVARAMGARPAGRDALLRAAAMMAALPAASLADSLYRGVLARAPEDIGALEAVAELAEARGDTLAAVGLYLRAAAQDSSGPIAQLALLRLTRQSHDGARLLLRRAAWRGMDELQRLELTTTAIASGQLNLRVIARSRPALERRQRVADLLRATLDTIVFARPWGLDELRELRLAYPGSALIERYMGRIAEREGNDSAALVVYDAVLRRDAADPVTQAARAALLERMGRGPDAITAYTRAFDLAPEDDAVFRALQTLRQRDGSLADLLAQVRRLRVRLPRSRVLGEHEVEVLQRLGRLDEAAAVAAKLKEMKL